MTLGIVGIPEPDFGIDETYRMYDEVGNRKSGLTYVASPDAGYFTHYVDSSDPAATDSGNTYGSVAVPRKTCPHGIPEGSVVEIHHTCDVNHAGVFKISGLGSVTYPIFVRGVDITSVPSIEIGYNYNTAYIIIEGLVFYGLTVVGRYDLSRGGDDYDTNHVGIRDCEAVGTGISGEGGGRIGINAASYAATNYINNIVISQCICRDGGDWTDYETDQDKGGFEIGENSSYIWVVDCTVYHNSCNGLQILSPVENGSTDPDAASTPHFIYVGRNEFYENMQPGFWSKTATDVIFSQNISHDHKTDTNYGTLGAGAGGQYTGKRIWYILNELYDNHHGIKMSSNSRELRDEHYFIGNIIYDCAGFTNMNGTHELVADYGDGIQLDDCRMATNGTKILCNIINNCCCGVNNDYDDSDPQMFNNVIADCTHDRVGADSVSITHRTVRLNATGTPAATDYDYNLNDGSGGFDWDGTVYANLAALIAGTSEGDNCIESDPLFTDPDNGDFTFQSGSPISSLDESSEVQAAFDRFYTLYGISIEDEIRALFGESEGGSGTVMITEKKYTIKPSIGVQLDRGNSLANGLVGCWIMNEGGGMVINDLSSHANHGALTLVNWLAGKGGLACDFASATSRINCGNSGSHCNLPALSLFTRCYPRSRGGGNLARLFEQVTSAGAQAKNLIIDDAYKFKFGIKTSSSEIVISSAAQSMNAWYNLAVTWPGDLVAANEKMYLDGLEIAVTPAGSGGTIVDDAGGNFYIGNRNDNTRNFDGLIEVFYLWNRVLTAYEIAEVSKNPYCMFNQVIFFPAGVAAAPVTLQLAANISIELDLAAAMLAAQTLAANIPVTVNVAGNLTKMPLDAAVNLFVMKKRKGSALPQSAIDLNF